MGTGRTAVRLNKSNMQSCSLAQDCCARISARCVAHRSSNVWDHDWLGLDNHLGLSSNNLGLCSHNWCLLALALAMAKQVLEWQVLRGLQVTCGQHRRACRQQEDSSSRVCVVDPRVGNEGNEG